MILFLAAGFAAWRFWGQRWAPPVGLLLGLYAAPFVPLGKRDA